jgi:hypothetical protein
MATVEERLAMLEGRMDAMGDLRTLMANVGDQMHRGFEELRGQLDHQTAALRDLRGEIGREAGALRVEVAELRGEIGREAGALRVEVADLRGEMVRRFEHVEGRITTVDDRHDRHFTWLVGLQLTMMLAVIGVLLAAYLG